MCALRDLIVGWQSPRVPGLFRPLTTHCERDRESLAIPRSRTSPSIPFRIALSRVALLKPKPPRGEQWVTKSNGTDIA
ncbi:hypothetical protein AM571_CH03333 [Rhizobium etli 8C-3]|uniref:Uncharacterized protein n=1 Tax=Rhizobium etli 8C-3 TaxID=538025 RepID=A0A1L5P7F3_RHIET|nr:hypothetical protein AM571_CH03333 [Rhizobium etli 8C-3]